MKPSPLTFAGSGIAAILLCLLLPRDALAQKCAAAGPRCSVGELCGGLCSVHGCTSGGVCAGPLGEERPCDPMRDRPSNECGGAYCAAGCFCGEAPKTCVERTCASVQREECPASVSSGTCADASSCDVGPFSCEIDGDRSSFTCKVSFASPGPPRPDPHAAPPKPGVSPPKPDNVPPKSDAVPPKPDAVPPKPHHVPPPGPPPLDPDAVPPKPGASPPNPDDVPLKPHSLDLHGPPPPPPGRGRANCLDYQKEHCQFSLETPCANRESCDVPGFSCEIKSADGDYSSSIECLSSGSGVRTRSLLAAVVVGVATLVAGV